MPRTSARLAAAPVAQSIAAIEASLVSILVAIEGLPVGSGAARAYGAAIRRKGMDLMDAGPDAMARAMAHIRNADPARADDRERTVAGIWAGIPGWRT